MTASTKPEVHNDSQPRQRRTEPWQRGSCTEIWWRSVTWFRRYPLRQTDRQTNKTDHNTPQSDRGEVITNYSINVVGKWPFRHFTRKKLPSIALAWPMTLTMPYDLDLQSARAMVMGYSHAKARGQRSVVSEDTVETNGRTDGRRRLHHPRR